MRRTQGMKKIISGILALAFMLCLFLVPEEYVYAKDDFLSEYIQVVYNQQNGLGSSEINCIYQSSSGYVWVGTDGGLYRSKGSEFTAINLWDTDRTDVYSINCIIQDKRGRMWIGTENYGLFYIENGEIYHFQDEYYDGIKTIYDICETENGKIYVATAMGLYVAGNLGTQSGSLSNYNDENVENLTFSQLESFGDELWATYGDNKIYVFGEEELSGIIDTADISEDDINSLDVIEDRIYVGTTGSDIISFKNATSYLVLNSGVDGINCMMSDNDGRLWCCADNGIGYFNKKGDFIKLENCRIDSYITDAICDYEGNFWFASNRMGVLLLSRSKFQDYNMLTGLNETMVNAVCTKNNTKYIGTEDGLVIFSGDNVRITNELTDMLSGVRIRHIMSDSKGNLWISAYRRFGIVRVNENNEINCITKGNGLPSSIVNCSLELKDGRIAVATEDGVAILRSDGSVDKVYSNREGLVHCNINCLYQQDDGRLMLGSDGAGIYVIDLDNDNIENYTTSSGLNSDNITTIVGGKEGIWIGTDNGLCFYNESYRAISNIEYTNSIYDVLIEKDSVYIVGSMGLLITTESELIGNQGISGRYFDVNDGLSKTLNAVSKSSMDYNGILYLCCNTGICTIDTRNIAYNTAPPKIKVTSIDIDGTVYEFDDLAGSLEIDSDTSRVTIEFAVFSFSNRNNIQVEYYLDGFDQKPIIIKGNDAMKAVYTNLDGGEYEFVISAYNGDGVKCVEDVSFIIDKDKSFFENRWARIMIIVLVLVIFLAVVYFVIRIAKVLKSKNTAIEKLAKEHEKAVKSSSAKNDYLANMSNEIKTPINAIVARADELIQLTPEEDARKEIMKNIYSMGNDIIEKVDDIILLAKIEAGKLGVVNLPYSVPDLIYQISEEALSKLNDKAIKFFVEMGEDTQENLVGDVDKIREILSRIVDNAIKYTKEGSITLSVDCFSYNNRMHHDMVNVQFTVSDTGIGIHEEKIDNIFEVSNINDNMKSNHSGIGVGLAIAKGYADMIGAQLDAESVYGAGSTFSLSINQRIANVSSQSGMVAKIEGTVSKEEAEKLWLPDVSILLVDDDDVSREVAAKTLEKFEMKVDVATSGISAIDMVLNNKYDVVFMDINMPVMNGVEAMKEIRDLAGEDYAYLSIIAMDTDAIEENRDELLSAGFTDSILKPLDIRRVAALLKDCLPQDKLKEKTNDMKIYIGNSRFNDGLVKLAELLDIEAALEKIGGSIDVYNKLITIFYNQNAYATEELYEKYGKDARGFKTKIHSIKTNSINIGATALAQSAIRMESAINIGNRDYVKDNLEEFMDLLVNVLLAIEEYQEFVDSIAGTSVEQKQSENTKEQEEQEEVAKPQNIDLEVLENIKYTALDDEFEAVNDEFQKIKNGSYIGDDKEFIEVLEMAIETKDISKIDELISTYLALKM